MDNNIKKNNEKNNSDFNLENIEYLDLNNPEILDFDDNETVFTMAFNPDENNNIEVLEFELEFKNNDEKIEVLEFDTVEVENLEFELEDIINNGEDALIIEQKSISNNEEDTKSFTKEITKQAIKIEDKKRAQKKQILIFILIFMLAALAFVIYKIISWNLQNESINNQIKEINEITTVTEVKDKKNTTIVIDNPNSENNEENDDTTYIDRNNDYYRYIEEPLIDVNFTNLLEKNSDTAGWLQVNGTNINYPIVQTDNNDYYLNHAFDGSYNEAGWIFADYRNNFINDRNLIIYGHARLNSTMFGTLKNVVKSFWYTDKNNYVIKISTPKVNSSWQVFSTYAIDPEDYYLKTYFDDDNSFLEFAKILKARSVYDYNVELKPTDRILTLSTCYSNNQRIVLHAKLIKYENKE